MVSKFGGIPVETKSKFGGVPVEQSPDYTPVQQAVGVGEAALSMASSLPAEVVAGLASMSPAMIPFNDGKPGTRTDDVRQALTYSPRTDAGQEAQRKLGEVYGPIIEKLSGLEQYLGDKGNELAGPVGGAVASAIPTGLAEVAGLAGLKTGANALKRIPERQNNTRDLIESGSTDNELAELRVNEKGKVKTDKYAVAAINQGFDKGVVQAVKQSSPTDRQQMIKMVNIAQVGRKNKRQSVDARPTDVVGDSLMGRYKEVHKQNRLAGGKLDSIAKSLKGQEVDYSPAVNQFAQDLKDMGISVDSELRPIFKGSDIEGVAAAERVVNQIMLRMRDTKVPDGYDVHRLKKFIDEQVTFGKKAEGLSGKTETVLKNLRRNLDGVLDSQFPEYDAVNTRYAETIQAMNAFQDAAGSKMNLQGVNADKAVGTLMRRLMSNAQSRVRLSDAIDELDRVAGQTAKFSDDIKTQILFADELDTVFGPVARTSLQGELSKAGKVLQTAEEVTNNPLYSTIRGASALADKAAKSRVNEDAAFRAIRELLRNQ